MIEVSDHKLTQILRAGDNHKDNEERKAKHAENRLKKHNEMLTHVEENRDDMEEEVTQVAADVTMALINIYHDTVPSKHQCKLVDRNHLIDGDVIVINDDPDVHDTVAVDAALALLQSAFCAYAQSVQLSNTAEVEAVVQAGFQVVNAMASPVVLKDLVLRQDKKGEYFEDTMCTNMRMKIRYLAVAVQAARMDVVLRDDSKEFHDEFQNLMELYGQIQDDLKSISLMQWDTVMSSLDSDVFAHFQNRSKGFQKLCINLQLSKRKDDEWLVQDDADEPPTEDLLADDLAVSPVLILKQLMDISAILEAPDTDRSALDAMVGGWHAFHERIVHASDTGRVPELRRVLAQLPEAAKKLAWFREISSICFD